MLSDQMHNDHVNPFTATNTFGVASNGEKYRNVVSVETEVDDDVMFTPGEVDKDTGIPKDQFNPLTIDRAGNRYLKTISSANAATSFYYPARKYQFDNGSTTFGREVVLMDAKNYVTPDDFPKISDQDMVRYIAIGAGILLVILLAFQRK
jgi:hypothetical protein